MSAEPKSGANYIDEDQAQKGVTHNQGIQRLAAMSQIAVTNRTTTAPPGSPALGQQWIVGTGATGLWAGHDGDLVTWYAGWVFQDPLEGWWAYDQGADEYVKYTGSAWVVHSSFQTGWGAITGTLSRAGFDTSSITLVNLAQVVGQLITDLKAGKLPRT
jgi:hypothetical protein